VDLERGPLSLLSAIEELLERNSSGSSIESREYCLRDPPSIRKSWDYLGRETKFKCICLFSEIANRHE
jgi:hypothetical protein